MSVWGGAVVAEVWDEEGLCVDDDDSAGLDVVNAVKGRDLLRSWIVEAIGDRDLAEVDVKSATPS